LPTWMIILMAIADIARVIAATTVKAAIVA
jgi:hypothetical protein